MAIPLSEMLLRLAIALLLGALVGFERERDRQPAGLRTHMVLVLGSCLVMLISINIAKQFDGDPARLAAQVVSGIGFLGAGAIFRYGFNIRGLTTATTLWTTAIIGLVVGYGQYVLAVVATVFLLFVLTLLQLMERKFIHTEIMHTITIDAGDRPGLAREIRKSISELSELVTSFSMKKSVKNQHLRFEILAFVRKGEKTEKLVETLAEIEGVREIKIE